jgi:hypothetical protein
MHFENFNLFISTRTLQSASIEQHGGAICYRYGSQDTTVVVHIATSLISPEQASYNLDSELTGRSFDEVKEETRLVWNRSLLNSPHLPLTPHPLSLPRLPLALCLITSLSSPRCQDLESCRGRGLRTCHRSEHQISHHLLHRTLSSVDVPETPR